MIEDFLNKIIQGDSSEVVKKLPDESVDLVVCSPPSRMTGKSINKG